MVLATHTMSALSPEEMEQIWQAALRVFTRVPLRAQGPEEFTQPLRDFGCEVSGEHLTFPPAVLDKLLDRVEQSRRTNGPCRAAQVQSDTLSYAASGQALVCCDLETEALDLRQLPPARTLPPHLHPAGRPGQYVRPAHLRHQHPQQPAPDHRVGLQRGSDPRFPATSGSM